EAVEKAVAQQFDRHVPVGVAGAGQLVEVAALPAGGEDERRREGLGAGGDGAALVVRVEGDAVEVTELRVRRIDPRAGPANVRHDEALFTASVTQTGEQMASERLKLVAPAAA